MSYQSTHITLHTVDSESYSLICTTQRKGCQHRHGPPLKRNESLGFSPCPNCESQSPNKRVKRNPISADGVKWEGI